jgi:hypothetical protein
MLEQGESLSACLTIIINTVILKSAATICDVTLYSACCQLLAGFLLDLLLEPEDGGNTFLWNIGALLPDYTVLRPRRWYY